jgi:TonB family protein
MLANENLPVSTCRGLGGAIRDARVIVLVCCCLCAVPLAFAQSDGLSDFHISARVQRHLDDAGECRDNGDFDCARASLEKIAKRNLSDIEQYRYWQSLGRVEFFDGNFSEAIEAFRIVAELAPSPSAHLDYVRYVAQLHASMGQFKQAYETLDELLADSSANQYPRSHQLQSVAEQQAGMDRFQAAYDTLEELLVRNGVVHLAWRHLTNDALWLGLDIYATGDRVLIPLVAEPPAYPREAAARGLSNGFVDLEFTVTRTGSTTDVRVVDSSASIFESAAIEAAESLKYKPRLANGKPVETPVERRIEFQMEAAE